jgi:N-acetylmuramoyl-L-alanine amidase
MAKHSVSLGECFSSLAQANGFFDYLTLYNHGTNAALKSKRPNPNQLEEGDSVDIPAKQVKKLTLPADQEHKFVVVRTKTKVRIAIADATGKPLKVKSARLDVGARTQKKAGGGGVIELEMDPTATGGSLTVTWDPPKATAPPKAAAPASTSPPSYPPPIVAAQFEDKTATLAGETSATWTLHVGALEPKESTRGCLRRLANLGYTVPVNSKAENAQTAVIVKAYQRKHGLMAKGSESGKIADVRADLETRHDVL